MKYKFQVMIALTYQDKNVRVNVELSEQEMARVKQLVADKVRTEARDLGIPVRDVSLLSILEDEDKDLFNKFWDVILPPVFIEQLINGFNNGYLEPRRGDHFDDYHEADFEKVYDMYGKDIELEHSSCCICRIPKDWLPKK